MVWNQFWDRLFQHFCIQLRVQNGVGKKLFFDGMGAVSGAALEHSYSITCSKVRSEMNAFWWSGNGFGIGFLSIRIELRDQDDVQK